MFDTAKIKNRKRGAKNKIRPRSLEEILEVNSFGRVLPYLEIVPEQISTDVRYTQLNRTEQGDFWRLIPLLWRGGGAHLDHPCLAKDLGMPVEEWNAFKQKLIDSRLLAKSYDGYYIVQPELRVQYLQTLESCDAKSH